MEYTLKFVEEFFVEQHAYTRSPDGRQPETPLVFKTYAEAVDEGEKYCIASGATYFSIGKRFIKKVTSNE